MHSLMFTIWVIGSFFFTAFLFFIAVQRDGHLRVALAIFHILAVFSLAIDFQLLPLSPSLPFFVPFLIGLTVHTTSILFLEKKTSQLRSLSLLHRLKKMILLWSDFRGIYRNHAHGTTKCVNNNTSSRLTLGIKKTIRALALWYLDHRITSFLFDQWLGSLNVTLDDFSPAMQGLSSLAYRDLVIRGVISTHWIWSTYLHLTAAHDLCTVLFVSVLGWSEKSDWPPLYGSVTEAYSLRRFWGIFWHRLHVAPFAAYTPSLLDHRKNQRYSILKKMLRSLWVFLLSAGCHSLVNLVLYRQIIILTEVRFFLYNWAACLLETILGQAITGTWLDIRSRGRDCLLHHVRRGVGYISVLAFFLCTVPAWQYPLMYN
jgi:hypothetical protein